MMNTFNNTNNINTGTNPGMNNTNVSNVTRHQPQITETFVQKILAHLDDNDVSKLNNFLQLFSNNSLISFKYFENRSQICAVL